MKVVLLGTGTPNCEPDRMGPSLAVVCGSGAVLVDCGPGVVRRMVECGIPELSPQRAVTLFLTHLHSDHTAGLADLFLSPCVLGRAAPLRVFGPTGTASMCSHVSAAYAADVAERSRGLEPNAASGYLIDATEIAAGASFEVGAMRVSAFTASHGAWPAFGYRFESDEGCVVVSGDTAPHDGMESAYAGADVLVHEVYSSRRLASLPQEWQAYHRAMHTGTEELARIATHAQPKLLVLTHQLLWGATPEDLLAEIAEGYSGRTAYGRDLDVFTTEES